MMYHVMGKFETHSKALESAGELERQLKGRVSVSTTTPHEEWKGTWLENSFGVIGGLAAAVSAVVPGFGVLFLGGPMDGAMQGRVLADWLEAHPDSAKSEQYHHFVIVACSAEQVDLVKTALKDMGAEHVHVVKE
ncbi:MAG: hypothetical protein OWR52_06700 [Acidibacillus sp.]|uniref:DUF1269 domain-containing protein n=1 Tax=Sulfoacidibacillus ferrooxidans TaxID=2005001 RepID=A0A9X1V7R3_9BACL|nr:hypothetical protein [Sulfoacidibacillus ferrooxidans]MCI0183111.1 hypothetical protein [Sulfoacidibacillus ferrooxidans]MCY0893179.1 hypothetical protein [Acidibacillus sp.]